MDKKKRELIVEAMKECDTHPEDCECMVGKRCDCPLSDEHYEALESASFTELYDIRCSIGWKYGYVMEPPPALDKKGRRKWFAPAALVLKRREDGSYFTVYEVPE